MKPAGPVLASLWDKAIEIIIPAWIALLIPLQISAIWWPPAWYFVGGGLLFVIASIIFIDYRK